MHWSTILREHLIQHAHFGEEKKKLREGDVSKITEEVGRGTENGASRPAS